MPENRAALAFTPRVAVTTALLYALVAAPALLGGGLDLGIALASTVLGLGLVLLTAIDMETFRLPNILTYPLAAAGLAAAVLLQVEPPVAYRAVAALGAYGVIWGAGAIYQKLRGEAGIGLGDAKLFAVAGAWTGPDGLPSVLLYACAGGLAYAGYLALRGRALARDEAIPFGPYLAAALWIVWLYGPAI